MNESNSIKAIDKKKISEQTKLRLSEIIRIVKIIFIKRLIKENHTVKN